MNSFLKGLGVALVTPFRQGGEVDFPALERLVDHVIEGGVDYLVALGTTAETPTLFPEERDRVLDCIRRRNGGRRPIVLGMGSYNTAGLIEAIGRCDLEDVSAILSVTPYYNRPSQRGLYEHYKAIAAASPLPLILYNLPVRTGVNMLPETTLRLAREVDNIVAIKEACGDMAQFEQLLAGRPDGFRVISGDDNMALPLIERGGDGLISVGANAFPAYFAGMIAKTFAGRKMEADREWKAISDCVRALTEEGNPTGIKAALSAKGMIENILRLPLVEASPALYAKISDAIGRNNF